LQRQFYDMFNKIKKFFSKKDKTNNNVAQVTFGVSEDDSVPTLDILIEDYSDETLDALAKILFTIQSPTCMLETLNVVIENLRANDQDKAAIALCMKLGTDFLTATPQTFINNLATQTQESQTEEPCIKPSDMLQ